MMSPAAMLKAHFTVNVEPKSPELVEREKFVFKCIPFNRWMLVPAAVIIQLCIGSLYAWSVFNIPIEKSLGLEAGTSAITFYIAVAFFGFSAAVFGPWLERNGPRKTLLFSSTMVLLGMCLAGLGAYVKKIGLIYFGYGVVGGIGFGVSYITPVSPMQKWFPSKKGMLSGLAVCGFGGGSMAAAQDQVALIKTVGIPLTFVILGCCYFAIMVPMAFVLRTPPPNYVEPEQLAKAKSKSDISKKEDSNALPVSGTVINVGPDAKLKEPKLEFELLEALSTRDYWLMYAVLSTNACAGLLTISKLSDICQKQFGKTPEFAATVVSINSAFNLCGRFFYGTLSDFLGQKPIFVVSLMYQAIICGLTPTFIHHQAFWAYAVTVWFLAAFYGGGFGLIPAFLTNMFGSKNIGALHGIILTGWSLVGVCGGLIFTYVYTSQVKLLGKTSLYVYDIDFYWICAFVSMGFVASLFISTELRDRVTPPVPGQVFKLRTFWGAYRLQYVNKERDNAEYTEFLKTLPENSGAYQSNEETRGALGAQ